MNRSLKARYTAKARVLKAMAHPTRLFIVEELSRGERCVCELTEKIGDDISTISKHLSVLRGAGIVLDEKRGMQVFYTLEVPSAVNFFSCVDSVMGAREGRRVADGGGRRRGVPAGQARRGR